MFNLRRYFRYRRLNRLWDQVVPGMTVSQAEQIMGFGFAKDSENAAGRVVYSNQAQDSLPFYLVVDRSSAQIVRRHRIRALEEL